MYKLIGSYTAKDGSRRKVTYPTGSSNPQDVQYQHAKRAVAKAILKSKYYDEENHPGVTYRIAPIGNEVKDAESA